MTLSTCYIGRYPFKVFQNKKINITFLGVLGGLTIPIIHPCRYNYNWKIGEAQKNILRTHTTAVSARMLYQIAQQEEFKPTKLFRWGDPFRNYLSEGFPSVGLATGWATVICSFQQWAGPSFLFRVSFLSLRKSFFVWCLDHQVLSTHCTLWYFTAKY